MRADDIRYAGAAYVGGGFPAMPRGLNPREFWPALVKSIGAWRPGAGVIVLTATVDAVAETPIGWLFGWPSALGPRASIELHAAWAPWATARMRLEAILAFLLRTRASRPSVWCCRRNGARLYEHVCKFGVARRVGVLRGLYGRGEDGLMFQSVESR